MGEHWSAVTPNKAKENSLQSSHWPGASFLFLSLPGWVIVNMAILSQMSHMASGEKKNNTSPVPLPPVNFTSTVKSSTILSAPWHSASISSAAPHLVKDLSPITSPLSALPAALQARRRGMKACILRLPLPCNLLSIGPDRSQAKPLYTHTHTLAHLQFACGLGKHSHRCPSLGHTQIRKTLWNLH